MATENLGIGLCKAVYAVSAPLGWFPALTGGCLYKDGTRKDVDIVMYKRREIDGSQHGPSAKLLDALRGAGFEITVQRGWVVKAQFNRVDVDFLFPEMYRSSADSAYWQEGMAPLETPGTLESGDMMWRVG